MWFAFGDSYCLHWHAKLVIRVRIGERVARASRASSPPTASSGSGHARVTILTRSRAQSVIPSTSQNQTSRHEDYWYFCYCLLQLFFRRLHSSIKPCPKVRCKCEATCPPDHPVRSMRTGLAFHPSTSFWYIFWQLGAMDYSLAVFLHSSCKHGRQLKRKRGAGSRWTLATHRIAPWPARP